MACVFLLRSLFLLLLLLFFSTSYLRCLFTLSFFPWYTFRTCFPFVVVCIVFPTPVFVTLPSTFRDLYAHAWTLSKLLVFTACRCFALASTRIDGNGGQKSENRKRERESEMGREKGRRMMIIVIIITRFFAKRKFCIRLNFQDVIIMMLSLDGELLEKKVANLWS